MRRATQLGTYDGQKVQVLGTYGWQNTGALVPAGGGPVVAGSRISNPPGGQGQLRLEDGTVLLLGPRPPHERSQWERQNVVITGTLHVHGSDQPQPRLESIESVALPIDGRRE